MSGLVLPPALAPAHVVLLPITMKAKDPKAVLAHCQKIADELRQRTFMGRAIEVEIDDRDIRGGDKVWGWIKKGIPVRVEVGERDMEAGTVFVGRRDRGHKDKASFVMNSLPGCRKCFPRSKLACWPKPKRSVMSTPK